MKTIRILFTIIVASFVVGCLNQLLSFFPAANQPGTIEKQFEVRLADLNEDLPQGSHQWKQFFTERGAAACWEKLQAATKARLKCDFRDDLTQADASVGDAVGAGIIRYLACCHSHKINNLTINGDLMSQNKKLTSLDPAIGQLTSLKKLDLSYNELTSLPPEFEQLASLEELMLSGNPLTWLPVAIGQLKSLKSLHLIGNQLKSLPAAIGQLTSLKKLDLSCNELTSLPPEFEQLASLEELNLVDNQLTWLPAAIGQLKSLKSLHLFQNQLKSLPVAIGQLTSLEELDLVGNQLIWLPAAIGQLTSLKKLNLSCNELASLPAEIGQLMGLEELHLDGNQLICLSEKLLPWWQQIPNECKHTANNPWLQADDLISMNLRNLEGYQKQLVQALSAFRKSCVNLAQANQELMKKEDEENKEAYKESFMASIGSKKVLDKQLRIIFFEDNIPFHLDRQLFTQQDVDEMLENLRQEQHNTGRQYYWVAQG
ncbi:MAG: leucine-rich repeat domain-containing protein [Bacteroidota bacterium]